MNYLTSIQILFLHSRIIDETGVAHGVNDPTLLLSAAGRPQAGFGGQDLYPDLLTKAAALMDSLIRNHPFMDGNKRTAIAATGLFLERNGKRLVASQKELEVFTLDVAAGRLDLPAIATWLQAHVQDMPIDGS